MKNFSIIKLDDWKTIASDILTYLRANPKLIQDDFKDVFPLDINLLNKISPTIHTIEKQLNKTIVYARIHCITRQKGSITSSDIAGFLEIPVHNCEGALTTFYKEKDNAKFELKNSVNGTHMKKLFPESSCDVIDSFILNEPIAYRLDIPHKYDVIINKYPRISLGLYFKEGIESLL
jgi:hypothetical protein